MLPLEAAVIDTMLASADPVWRDQRKRMRVTARDSSPCGFFTTFEHPPDAVRAPAAERTIGAHVEASVAGLQHPVGFVLFTKDGLIDFLEGYSYVGEDWNGEASSFSLRYIEVLRPPARTMMPLESAVIDMMLAGDHPTLALLRAQRDRMHVTKRDFTGVGFYTHFGHPPDAVRVPHLKHYSLGDVVAAIEGTEFLGQFDLNITDGLLDFLEAVTPGDAWPTTDVRFDLRYAPPRA